jgi:small neutral amino acid transporter SnatA (MarC family)
MTYILLIMFAVAGARIFTFGIGVYSFMVADEVLPFIVSIELTTHCMAVWK